ncbi:MAG: DUF4203 domain-containing protein [Ornithinibacter sp.]
MADIVSGLFALLAGGLLLFAGQFVLRFVLLLWGGFTGFALGAGLFAGLADERFLGSVLGWVTGFLFALVFAALAYFSYAVAVVLAMASIGFAIGSSIVIALGIDWNWLAVLVGLAFGLVLGLVSAFGDLPMIVLAVVSSIAGAVSVVAGVMLIVGALDSEEFTGGAVTGAIEVSPWWSVAVLVLAVVGIVAQTRARNEMRRDLRQTWAAEPR